MSNASGSIGLFGLGGLPVPVKYKNSKISTKFALDQMQ
jgi:hypothetical protein